MKVVLDTNVIISALFWGGIPEKTLKKAQKDHILCFTEETLNELKETFHYPKFIPHIQKLTFTNRYNIIRIKGYSFIF